MKGILSLCFCLLFIEMYSQSIYTPNLEHLEEEFDNIYSEEIHSDSLSSSFLILIRNNVPLHKHEFHSEHVFVLEGTGEMTLGTQHVSITKGDLVIIPKGTPHSVEVTSMDPLRILSIQSPKFTGKDRVLIK